MEAAAAATARVGPAVLDHAAAVVVGLEGRSPHREARYRGSLAPGRVPLVLALEIASAPGTAADHTGDPRSTDLCKVQ